MFKNRYILAATTISIIALQGMLWLLILKGKNLPSEVALWYTLPIANRLAPVSYLWIVPAIALSCWLINLALGWWLYRRYPAMSKLLVTVSAAICLLAIITIVQTVSIYASIL